jgi:dTMP kinase
MFITVEGLDGCGSTTLVESIAEEYPDSVTTSEPSDLEYGQLMRRNLSDSDSDPIVDFYLFMADRRNHIKNRIKPEDERGNLVVCDRYADSTRAYQPVTLSGDDRPFDSQWQAKIFIEQTMAHWLYEPDLTLYINISVGTALDRASGGEKYENVDFLSEAHKNYIALADSHDRIVTIDGMQSKSAVREDALDVIERFK